MNKKVYLSNTLQGFEIILRFIIIFAKVSELFTHYDTNIFYYEFILDSMHSTKLEIASF